MCVISKAHVYARKTVIIIKKNDQYTSLIYKNDLTGVTSKTAMLIIAPSSNIISIEEKNGDSLKQFINKFTKLKTLVRNLYADDYTDGFVEDGCVLKCKKFKTENYQGVYGELDDLLIECSEYFDESSEALLKDLKFESKGKIVIAFKSNGNIKSGNLQINFKPDDDELRIPLMHETSHHVYDYNQQMIIDGKVITLEALLSSLQERFNTAAPILISEENRKTISENIPLNIENFKYYINNIPNSYILYVNSNTIYVSKQTIDGVSYFNVQLHIYNSKINKDLVIV